MSENRPVGRFLRSRSLSLSMVVLMLSVTLVIQASISYSVSFGPFERLIPAIWRSALPAAWMAARVALLGVVAALWLMNRKRALFRAIIALDAVLTLGLFINMLALLTIISRFSSSRVGVLLTDVLLMAVSNILIFSVWYWIIDPPGVEERPRHDEPWDFLFPQRGSQLPGYASWLPRYTDYLYLAFTTSFAFSPTDTLPLTRRAKMLMLLQAAISIVTLTGIAGGALNLLMSGSS